MTNILKWCGCIWSQENATQKRLKNGKDKKMAKQKLMESEKNVLILITSHLKLKRCVFLAFKHV